jgi:hypothetical protein
MSKDVKILIAEETSTETAEKLGAAVLQKPYSLEELGRIVREVLDKNHKLQSC